MARALSGIEVSIDNLQNSNALVLYKVGPVLVCSPALPVESITIPPGLNRLPGTNNAEPGVFKSIHGMVRVIDLRVRFGVDAADIKSPGRIIISEVTGGYAGFWVDEIEDIMSFPEKGWSQLPPLVPREVFSRALISDEGIRLYADLENLDKFKATGYLRSHIESIKSAEVKRENKKTNEDKKEISVQSKYDKKNEDKSSSLIFPDKSDIKISHKSMDDGSNKKTIKNNAHEKQNASHALREGDRVRDKRYEVVNNNALKKIKKPEDKIPESTSPALPESANKIEKDYKIRNRVVNNSSGNSLIADSSPLKHVENKTILPTVEESDGYVIWASLLILSLLVVSVYLIEFSGFIDDDSDGYSVIQEGNQSVSKNSRQNMHATELKEVSSYSGDKVDITQTDEGIVIVINDYEKETDKILTENIKQADDVADLKEGGFNSDATGVTFETEEDIAEFKDDYIDLNKRPVSDTEIKKTVINAGADSVFNSSNQDKTIPENKSVAESKGVKTLKYVHVIVKGDTLWRISERYVNDPWRYPELARLSKIKDPDLIYPGQKVIIIYNTDK